MFNRAKFELVCGDLYKKGLADSTEHVAGILTYDRTKGSRKNLFLKIINAGRYSRSLIFMTISKGKIYCFPYKKEQPDYDNMWELSPELIDKEKFNRSMIIKVKNDLGADDTIGASVGSIVPDEFMLGLSEILKGANN